MASYKLTAVGATPAEWVQEFGLVGVLVSGEFGGGTVTIEYSAGGSPWVADGTLGSQTSAFTGAFPAWPQVSYRATLSGTTGPYDIDVHFLS